MRSSSTAPDDQEKVVSNRLNVYEAMTAELLPYYEKHGLLRRVDGVGPVDEVTRRVLSALARPVNVQRSLAFE